MLCISTLVDDVIFSRIAPYGADDASRMYLNMTHQEVAPDRCLRLSCFCSHQIKFCQYTVQKSDVNVFVKQAMNGATKKIFSISEIATNIKFLHLSSVDLSARVYGDKTATEHTRRSSYVPLFSVPPCIVDAAAAGTRVSSGGVLWRRFDARTSIIDYETFRIPPLVDDSHGGLAGDGRWRRERGDNGTWWTCVCGMATV